MRNPKNAPFEMPAVGVYLHQHYSNKDPANPINDIAAIELANAFSPSHYPTVAPICLGPDASPDDSVTIIGYGITDCDVNQQKTCYHRATVSKSAGNQSYRRAKHRAAQRSSEPSILRQGTQIVRSQKFCVDMYKRTKKNITKGMLCTKVRLLPRKSTSSRFSIFLFNDFVSAKQELQRQSSDELYRVKFVAILDFQLVAILKLLITNY